ncbi:hypothetical protein [Tahibacter harae]|uniref:Uncharacterized protein n=1 Tax=Tahibacter harae TaxID=2963937 RepID=A0ABT1QY41_9GAMM|nr:hypothetical protein [Tahibacter harae]MCQ4167206.1 hypothetical protein [Tahibacter harae]
MSRLILATAATALLTLAGAAFVAVPAARAAAPNSAAPAAIQTNTGTDDTPARPHRGPRGQRGAWMNTPVGATLRNLRELERLYLLDGRAQEIPALYRDVLARTQNPAVREFAFRRIARNELKPGDADKAIATLRQSLEENLQRLPQQ